MSRIGAGLTKTLVLAGLALALSASSGSAANRAQEPILGVVPHAGGQHQFTSPGTAGSLAAGGDLYLHESPCALTSSPYPCWTMRTNKVYAIYWVPSGYSVSARYESLINQYFGDVAADSGRLTNVYSVADQYYDNAAAIHYDSSFGGSYVDTHPFPVSGCDVGQGVTCLTDGQIQSELRSVLATQGWQGGTTTLFFVLTPNGVASCFDGLTNQCTTNTYCAYHSGFNDANGVPVLYANEPYDATISGCSSGSSPNGDDADSELNTISHEHNEAITDPAGDAWLNAAGDENGDICAWKFGAALGTVGGQSYNQVINGHQYWLQQEYSNDGSTCLQHYTPTTPPSIVAPPVLSGAAGESQLLSTSEGSWTHAPSGYGYTWQRCSASGTDCSAIPGATAATYSLTASDVGYTLRAAVSASNAAGTSASSATSAATAVVVPLPNSTVAPVLSGVAAVGRKLSTTTGTWNSTVTVTYEWLRCAADGTGCATIPGAVSATYAAVAADAGHTLEVRVSGKNVAGTAAAVSNRSGVVLRVPASRRAPHISGRARVGKRLSAGRGSWIGGPETYRFQWLRCNAHGKSCVRIKAATHPKYRLTKRDARHRLRVRVTAVNAAGNGAATSRATPRVPTAKS
jgi:hypothetical protein